MPVNGEGLWRCGVWTLEKGIIGLLGILELFFFTQLLSVSGLCVGVGALLRAARCSFSFHSPSLKVLGDLCKL